MVAANLGIILSELLVGLKNRMQMVQEAVHRAAIFIVKICRKNAGNYKNRFQLHGMVIEPLAGWLEYKV